MKTRKDVMKEMNISTNALIYLEKKLGIRQEGNVKRVMYNSKEENEIKII
ncbi:hypothetical protein [Clostridioides difficile]|nr:hypothetical protein [Clostridioides difficile]MCJ0310304.1 hypothetical protein [Clostridioides difficile]MCJ0377578.1 hypothetical protein [Clostridioides difficile]MCJ0411866.1 hypothetical protein [Clostridioides difficile]MCO8703403.1 hypothetical protein [Clostridioides difficile]MDF3817587.1 hypothetical protein [Clostridioides difficile]